MPPMRRSMRRTARRTSRRTARRVNRRQAAMAPPPQAAPQEYQPPPQAAPAPAEADVYEQLKKLGDLHAQGILTDEEFAAEKAKLLGN